MDYKKKTRHLVNIFKSKMTNYTSPFSLKLLKIKFQTCFFNDETSEIVIIFYILLLNFISIFLSISIHSDNSIKKYFFSHFILIIHL
jgi:hypothetical protein